MSSINPDILTGDVCVCGHTFGEHDQAWNSGNNCTICLDCNCFCPKKEEKTDE